MGRIFSREPGSDIETAAETIIDTSLISNACKKQKNKTAKRTVTELQQSDQEMDDFFETKKHHPF